MEPILGEVIIGQRDNTPNERPNAIHGARTRVNGFLKAHDDGLRHSPTSTLGAPEVDVRAGPVIRLGYVLLATARSAASKKALLEGGVSPDRIGARTSAQRWRR